MGTGPVTTRLLHLSDTHVMDVVSPARAEWVELLADDPHWHPLLHMHRPYEALALFGLAAHVERIAATGEAFDLVVNTGDTVDNAQHNELEAYLAVMAGGHAALPADDGVQDPRPGPVQGWDPWPFWSPLGTPNPIFSGNGYPVVEDFFERVAAGVHSAGLTVPWTSVLGNHDLMRQGTSLETPAMAALAVGAAKRLAVPADYRPDDPLAEFVDHPHRFSIGSDRWVSPDGGRRIVDRAGWVAAHRLAGAVGYDVVDDGRGIGDGVVDLDDVRVVLLDTNHPHGDYQGSIGLAQLEWLDERISEAEGQGRLVVIASHHGTRSLVNTRGDDPERRHGDALAQVAHRHRAVVAWLVGHRHIHHLEPRPGPAGGFWEISTCSTIDWPCQVRTIDIERGAGGEVRLGTTVVDHSAPAASLAALHLDLAERFMARRPGPEVAGVTRWLDRPGR